MPYQLYNNGKETYQKMIIFSSCPFIFEVLTFSLLNKTHVWKFFSQNLTMTPRTDQDSSNEAPASKRARIEDDSCTTTKRTEELAHEIQKLAKSFPELKYIIDLTDLSKIVEPAVVKYKHEAATEKNKKSSLIYKIPEELLKNIFSFVGKGSFLFVAPVSRKFHQMYKTTVKECNYYICDDTYYSTAACNVSTAKYCLDIIGCRGTREDDYRKNMAKIFVQAAYKGRIEILKLAHHFDISYFWNRSDSCQFQLLGSPIERIAELGHLNVLQFLHDTFNMHFALPIASRGAAFGGQIHVLKWLQDNDILYDIKNGQEDTLCYSALAGGQLDTLKWLRKVSI